MQANSVRTLAITRLGSTAAVITQNKIKCFTTDHKTRVFDTPPLQTKVQNCAFMRTAAHTTQHLGGSSLRSLSEHTGYLSWKTDRLLTDLKKNLSEDQVTTAYKDLVEYGQDASQQFKPNPSMIVFPRTKEEITDVVKLANKWSVGIVPSGGRTGLSAGATATHQEMVISLRDMNKIYDYCEADKTVYCEAGVTIQELQEFAQSNDKFFPPDWAAKASAQIGGAIATNAGGVRVLKWGSVGDWVEGLTIITPQGELLDLNKCLKKDATGLDLRSLYKGTEGSMGIIAGATMRLTEPPKNFNLCLLGLNSLEDAIQIKKEMTQHFDLSSLELFSANSLIRNPPTLPLKGFAPDTPYYLLVECVNFLKSDSQMFNHILRKLKLENYCNQSMRAKNPTEAEQLWALRKGINGSLSKHKPYKFDVSVKPALTAEFVSVLKKKLATEFPQHEFLWFGHIGDGNMHLNLIPKTDTGDYNESEQQDINKLIFSVVKEFQGSVSAEHGLGRSKQPFQPYSRSALEMNMMRDIKRQLDPNDRFQPGAIFSRR